MINILLKAFERNYGFICYEFELSSSPWIQFKITTKGCSNKKGTNNKTNNKKKQRTVFYAMSERWMELCLNGKRIHGRICSTFIYNAHIISIVLKMLNALNQTTQKENMIGIFTIYLGVFIRRIHRRTPRQMFWRRQRKIQSHCYIQRKKITFGTQWLNAFGLEIIAMQHSYWSVQLKWLSFR